MADPKVEQPAAETPQDTGNEAATETPQDAMTSQEAGNDEPDSSGPENWFEERPSEAQLRGEDESDSEDPGTNKTDPSRPSGEEEPKEGDEGDDSDKTEPKGDEPDNGDEFKDEKTVPLKALQEERRKRQEVQAELKAANERVAKRQQARAIKPETKDVKQVAISEDLQPLVDEFTEKFPQFAGMTKEDSPEGQELRTRLEDYDPAIAADFARGITLERKLNSESENISHSETNEYLDQCKTGLNNLFPEGTAGGETASKAVEFAGDRGLAAETILLLTNPATVLTDSTTGKQIHLGHRAVEVAGFIKDSYDYSSSIDPDSLRSSLESELKDSITANVTKQLTEKFRGNDPDSTFRSLGDGPGASEEPEGSGHNLSEAEWAALPEADKAKYLGG